MRRRDVGQRQIKVETTLCISTLKCTTSNNVEPTLCISTLIWTTLDNVQTTLSFSTSSFTRLVNVETTLWKWPPLKRTTKNNNTKRIPGIQSFTYYFIIFTCSHVKRSMSNSTCKAVKVLKRLWKILHCNNCKSLI